MQERNTLDDSSYVQEIGEKLREFLEESFPRVQEDKVGPPPAIAFERPSGSGSPQGQGLAEGRIPFRVEHDWTGIMAYSRDGLPLIGPLTSESDFPQGSNWANKQQPTVLALSLTVSTCR